MFKTNLQGYIYSCFLSSLVFIFNSVPNSEGTMFVLLYFIPHFVEYYFYLHVCSLHFQILKKYGKCHHEEYIYSITYITSLLHGC